MRDAQGRFPQTARGLARNSLINVLGQFAPVAVAVAAIPLLLNGLGRDRFGLLTLAWAAVGWFSVLDLGLARATTRVVALKDPTTEEGHTRSIVLLAISGLFALGCIAGLAAALATPVLISDVLNVPLHLEREAEGAFVILSASLPFVLASSGARGAVEGAGRFDWVNAIRVPSAALLFLAPVALLAITHDLRVIVATISINRMLAFAAFLVVAVRVLGPRTAVRLPPAKLVRPTLTYAGWTGATNAFGTVLAWGYLDRYVIGAVLGVGTVAVYATPLEIVTKLLLYPMALMAVFFPVFARSHRFDSPRLAGLEASALRAAVLPLLPIVIGGVAASEALLSLYIGADFARDATTVTQLLLLGAFAACVAQVPFTVLQASERSDLTAKRHVVQLIFYVPLVIGMTSWFGITGTAITWLMWAVSDAILLFALARRSVSGLVPVAPWLPIWIGAAIMLAIAFMISAGLEDWAQVTAGVVLAAVAVGFLWLVLPETEKLAVKALFGRDVPAMQG